MRKLSLRQRATKPVSEFNNNHHAISSPSQMYRRGHSNAPRLRTIRRNRSLDELRIEPALTYSVPRNPSLSPSPYTIKPNTSAQKIQSYQAPRMTNSKPGGLFQADIQPLHQPRSVGTAASFLLSLNDQQTSHAMPPLYVKDFGDKHSSSFQYYSLNSQLTLPFTTVLVVDV